MADITRKKGAFHDLHFQVDLTNYGKTGTDVEDIMFSVKVKETDSDSILLYKTLLNSDISHSGTDLLDVLVKWNFDEYTDFKFGQEYKAGLFIKFTGDPVADENVDKTFTIEIVQDFLRA